MPEEMTRCPYCKTLSAGPTPQDCDICGLPRNLWPAFDQGDRAIELLKRIKLLAECDAEFAEKGAM